MRFLKFLKEHWKVTSILVAIAIATGIGVAVVNAATIVLSVDTAAINFSSDSEVRTVNATVSLLDTTSTSGGTFSWTIADNNVAGVSNNEGVGTVTAHAAGKTQLTVAYAFEDKIETKVIPIMVPLVVRTDGVAGIMQIGVEGQVSCNAASGRYVEWTSSNSNIATVTANGNNASISAISGGTVDITASIPQDGLSYTFSITVGVAINEDEVTVEQGNTVTLTTNSASVDNVFWWSANEAVATVNNGVVTGVYAGSTTVFASCIDHDASNSAGDRVTVTVPYRVIQPATTVNVGDQVAITTTASPYEVSYSSSNNNVLSYNAGTGKFTANSTGSADISVVWHGNVETIHMNVIDGFSLSDTSLSLNIGQSEVISALVSNTEKPVNWTIGDPDMADIAVSSDGLSVTVTAKAIGASQYTTITATQEIDGIVKTATCQVKILNPVTSLTLLYNMNPITDTIAVPIGTGVFISAYLNFEGSAAPDNTKLSWISSDPSIISLNPQPSEERQQLCEVRGLKGGKATITVVSEDGLYVATADFYVTEGVESITLDKSEVTAQMALGKYQLTATVMPETAGVDKSVTWSTLDPNVVTVDQNGLVTFVGAGTTYISVTSNADTSKVAYCLFIITQQVNGIKMDYDRVTMNVGDDYRLTAVITPANATDQSVTWSSSNPAVVTVDESGMLHAVSSGNATVVVQTNDGGFIDMTNVTVLQPVTSIDLSETEISVKKGTVFWLNATVNPDTADNKNITWASSDTTLATVDQTGKVTTLEVGTVTISCVSQDNGAVAYCVVEITEPVTGLSLNTNYQEMVAGTKFVIVPTILPIEAPNKNVTFVSSDPEIATVDENGVVTALVGGKCEILVTTEESKLTATCTIVVKEFVSSIEISEASELLSVGSSIQFKIIVLSETASDKSVYWTSSNPAFATVDQTGKVVGISPGNVVITATAADGSGVSASVVIRVVNPVTSITLDKTKFTMYVGETVNIAATVNPQNASIKELEWTSDDPAVVRVYPDGDVEGVSSGRTIVRATSRDGNNVVAKCTVIVKDIIKASSVNINSSDIVMLKGKTRKLSAQIYPKNTNESIKWLSTDTSIVQVDDNGNIVTVGAGECQVIAYSSAGTVEDACTIHSIAMYCTSMKLEQYDTFNLYVDGAPSAVSWRSSNPRIASVDQNGLVVGRMPGECVITATVAGKTVTCYVKITAVDPGKFINIHD